MSVWEDAIDWIGDQWSSLGDDVKWINHQIEQVPGVNQLEDAVQSAVHEVEDVATSAQDLLKKIPVAGGLFGGIAGLWIAPLVAADNILQGQRVDRVALNTLSTALDNAKTVAPWATAVISLVPAIGPVVSGSIAAAVALASGEPIDQVMVDAVAAAIPGGEIAGALKVSAFAAQGMVRGAYQAVRTAIVQGKVNVKELAGSIAAVVPGLGSAVQIDIASGVSIAQSVANGAPIDQVALQGAIDILPTVMNTAQAKALIDKAVNGVGPEAQSAKETIGNMLANGQTIAPAMTKEQSDALHRVLTVATSVGIAESFQQAQIAQVNAGVAKQFVLQGNQAAFSDKVASAARNVSANKSAFDLGLGAKGHGMTNKFILTAISNLLSPDDRKSYDAAIAFHKGQTVYRVPMPKDAKEATKFAAFLTTAGALQLPKEKRDPVVKQFLTTPEGIEGVNAAINAVKRDASHGFVYKIFQGLGFTV